MAETASTSAQLPHGVVKRRWLSHVQSSSPKKIASTANGNDVDFAQNHQIDDQQYHYRHDLELSFIIQYNRFMQFFK